MIRQMQLWTTVRNGVRSVVKACRKQYLRKKGLPPDLAQKDLDRLALIFGGHPVRAIGYDHLSGWKRLGAFRLFVTCASNRHTVIYKNSVYHETEIPALEGLPVFPGPPEYLVYGCAERTLVGRYLPVIYLLRCFETGKHYQYLLEDLDQDYITIHGSDAILTVCKELPEVYRNMEDSLSAQDKQGLLCFDETFSQSILAYAEENLGRFARYRPMDHLNQVLATWDDLSEVYAQNLIEIYAGSTLHPIHGDLNPGNIRLNKQDAHRLKILDWEWAGIGGWWFDLVALLKSVSEDLEQEGLKVFLRASDMPCSQHEMRAYQWAKLQRGLFDASFFAKQILDSAKKANTRIKMENHMGPALQRAANALTQLQNMA